MLRATKADSPRRSKRQYLEGTRPELVNAAWQIWWALQDLNLGPTDYESAALTAELRARATLSNIECRTAANRWALTTADFPRPALPIHPARKVGPETLERCVQSHGRRCREHAAQA